MTDPYRPTTFDGIVGQPTDQIDAMLDGTDTPNFLFYGDPGTGKTTAARVIARRLQGSTDELMEFNSSDERGIETVREKIIPAANQTTLSGAPRVIFLDEMESMTNEAQEALRQPMEQSDSVFVLACNDASGVHSAVKSRCFNGGLEFEPLPNPMVRKRIEMLAERDGVDLTTPQLKTIVSFANGDMRGAIDRYKQARNGALSAATAAGTPSDGRSLERQAQQFLGEE